MAKFKKQLKNGFGFTLIEILVASLLTTMVIAMVFSIYMSGNDLWEIKRYQADLQGDARQAFVKMASDLRQASRTSSQIPSPNIVIPAAPNNDNIVFYLPTDIDGDGLITNAATGAMEWNINNPVQYQYFSATKQLWRQKKDVSNNWINDSILAWNVTGIQFIDNKIDNQLYLNEVKVIMTLNKITPRQRNISMTFTADMRLRN